MKQMTKRIFSLALAAAMCLSLLAVSASAVSYEAPSSGVVADNDTYISGATSAANTVVLSLLGINITSTNGAGIYQANGESDSYGTDSSNLGIFGSDINDNPDPYVYNFFYNLSSTQSGGSSYDDADYSAWTATPFTLVWDDNKSGPTGGASGTVTISIGGVVETTNPAFFYEPDILLGGSNDGYAEELAVYQETYNADYNPTVFLGYGTGNGQYAASGTRSDGLGLEYNMFDMTSGVVLLGQTVQNLMAETGKTTRYDAGPYEIAVDYDKYDRGLYYYAQSLFADGTLTAINYASSVAYDTDAEMWAVTQGSGRAAQYASGLGTDIYDLLADGYTFSDGTVVETSEVTTVSNQGGPGGGGGQGGGQGGQGGQGGGQGGDSEPTYGYYLTTAQLIEILNDSGSEDATGVIIGNAGEDSVYTQLTDAGIRFLGNLPTCVYGMTMQTVENGMGIPFYLSYFYYNQDSSLDPASFIYYWMENFYHVSDNSAMETVVSNMLDGADLPEGYAGASVENYNAEAIEEMILTGIAYYQDVLEPEYDAMVSEGTIESDSALFWTTLDTTVGIGTNVRNTNRDYEVTVLSADGTDSYGNGLYTFSFQGEAVEEEVEVAEEVEDVAETEEEQSAETAAVETTTSNNSGTVIVLVVVVLAVVVVAVVVTKKKKGGK